ncbi:myo-inositol 2-dehydrogenase [Anaerovirgula multivorans]|uniref:Myo-inositol 2-dehydrogenase n=1 Tax=Anaerovirgula multivorans TaxID=312168 RepID=A0A239CZE7_9FIRM|nr:inositol 2-dehydrogenase [Anaerovirgula multivorans]SNS25232.1 myo-inositol 2-dehydrogenase [Anaerovirgula multivorans]
MERKIKVGVIGVGRIGKLHAENLIAHFPNVEVKSVADPFIDNSKAWADNVGIKHTYKDYKEILNDFEIDVVLICSSTDTHADISIEAAKTGKHIFCEKPIDLTVEKIDKALSAVEKAGVKFQVGFNRRFDHNFKKVKEIVKDGRIGDVQILKITSRDPAPPPAEYVKVSGGIFLDMTIHDFDMARYLSGSEVEEVYVTGAVLVDPAIGEAGDIDTAIISLKFENGAIGVIDNSRKAAYGYDQRIEVFGSKGKVLVSNDTDTSAIISTEEGVFSDKPKYFFLERYQGSFREEMKEFFNAIIENKETPVVAKDGLKPVLIGLAAKKSFQEGRPVKIKEIEEEYSSK